MRTDESYDEVMKFILIGDSNVGKTSFINRFCYGTFKTNVPCTVGLEYGQRIARIGSHKVLIQLWDTAGQQRFRNITPSFYRSAMAIILMYSCDNRESFNSIAIWMKQISTFAEQNIPVLLVCNKADLKKKQVGQKQSQSLSQAYKLNLMMTSCEENINVEQTVFQLYKIVRRGNPKSNKKIGLQSMNNSSRCSC